MNEFDAWQKIINEWKEVNRMKRLNQELYDMLGGAFIYILEYSEKYNFPLPKKEGLFRMAERIHYLINEINDVSSKNQHPPTTPEDSTEPRRKNKNN